MQTVANPALFRTGIASELADIKARQALILKYDDWLLARIDEEDFRNDLREMRSNDEKSLSLLDTMEVQLGEKAQPKPATQRHVELAQDILDDNRYSLLERVAELGILKAMQQTCGTLVARALQSADKDVAIATTPIVGINSDTAKHVNWLKSLTNEIGLFQIAGEQTDTGVWGRVKQAVASATSFMGNWSEPMDDMPITSVLALDHRKVDALFLEIEKSADFVAARERYQVLYRDLLVHSRAEEEVFYRSIEERTGTDIIKRSIREHDEMRSLMEDIRNNPGSEGEFKRNVARLRNTMKHHVDEEEDDVFDLAKRNFSENELIVLSRRFKAHKISAQEDLGMRGITGGGSLSGGARDTSSGVTPSTTH